MSAAAATIAIVGLGAIGRPMAERIAAAGLPLVVCDVRPEAVGFFADPILPANGYEGQNWQDAFQLTVHTQNEIGFAAD